MPSSRSSSRRRLLALALVLVALALTAIGSVPPAGAAPIPEPDRDAFYAPPAGWETRTPGTILRTRSVTVTGLGIPVPVRSTQVLVRSSDSAGAPSTVVSTVMVPQMPYLLGPRPLVSYQPAIDSLGDQCNPSYTLRTGTEKELPLMALSLARGWAVVVTDYQGPDDAFTAGPLEGRGVLDGIRGALRIPGSGLSSSTPVGLMGYSGGGLATGWAAQLHPSYAPELKVRGVASGGTPADLEVAARTNDGSFGSGLVMLAAVGLSREYPQILDLLDDDGRAMVAEIGDMCVTDAAARFAFRRLAEFTTVPDPITHPTVAGVFDATRMGAMTPTAPVLLYHSIFDELIPHASAVDLRDEWCAGGARVDLYTSAASEHVVLAATGAPLAVSYLGARFLGTPAPSDC